MSSPEYTKQYLKNALSANAKETKKAEKRASRAIKQLETKTAEINALLAEGREYDVKIYELYKARMEFNLSLKAMSELNAINARLEEHLKAL